MCGGAYGAVYDVGSLNTQMEQENILQRQAEGIAATHDKGAVFLTYYSISMFDLPSASRNDERSNGVLAKSEGLCQTEMLYLRLAVKTFFERIAFVFT